MSDINGVNTPSPTLARLTSPVSAPRPAPVRLTPVAPSRRRVSFADIAPTEAKTEEGDSFSLGDIVSSLTTSPARYVGQMISGLPTIAGKIGQTAVGLGEFVVDTGADLIPGVDYESFAACITVHLCVLGACAHVRIQMT